MRKNVFGAYLILLVFLSSCSNQNAETDEISSASNELFKASHGDVKAQYSLYVTYNGTAPNLALYWLKQAAKNGNAEAQDTLSDLYREGVYGSESKKTSGIEKDLKLSNYWLEKAVSQNYLPAKMTFATLKSDGESGVEKNEKEACQMFLDMSKLSLKPLPFEEEESMHSIERSSIEENNRYISEAYTEVGNCYYFGTGFSRNAEKAYEYFSKSAESETQTEAVTEAQYRLGMINLYGIGREPNYADANFWLEKAVNGSRFYRKYAQTALGKAYLYGWGCRQDYVEAYKWINLAAAEGEDEAIKLRNKMKNLLTSEQMAEGQSLSKEWDAKNRD